MTRPDQPDSFDSPMNDATLEDELLAYHYGCAENEAAVEARLESDPAYRALYERVLETAGVLEEAATGPAPKISYETLSDPAPEKSRFQFFPSWRGVAIAAAVAFLCVAGWPLLKWSLADRDVELAKADALRLVVTGAPTASAEGALNYRIDTWDLDGKPRPAKVRWAAYDALGAVLADGRGESQGNWDVRIDAPLDKIQRVSFEADTGGHHETITLGARQQEEPPLVHMSVDKPLYRPGETLRVRGVFLNRLSLTPRPGGYRARMVDAQGQVKHDYGVQQFTNGVGVWNWPIPAAAAQGQYRFEIRDAKNSFTVEELPFEVRRFEPPVVAKKVILDRETYAPGAKGVAEVRANPVREGRPLEEVEGFLIIDGQEIWRGKTRLDDEGRGFFNFRVPEQVNIGRGRFALRTQYAGRVETEIEPFLVPIGAVEIAFHPEGGDLVSDLTNRIYVEARDIRERPVTWSGRVVDDRGVVVTRVSSEHQGRGIFELLPRSGRRYQLELETPSPQTFPLPEAREEGVVIRAEREELPAGAPVEFEVAATSAGPFVVAAYCRGVQVAQDSIFGDGSHALSLDIDRKIAGVLRLTVFDAAGRPWAERLVRRKSDRRIVVEVTPEKDSLAPGDTQKLNIQTRDETGKAVKAVLGLTVVDKAVRDLQGDPRIGLEDRAWFFADVRELEDVEEFMADHPKADRHIDLLLGTLGWRRFAWLKPEQFLAEEKDRGRRVLVGESPASVPVVGDSADASYRRVERASLVAAKVEKESRPLAATGLLGLGALLITGLFSFWTRRKRATEQMTAGSGWRAAATFGIAALVLAPFALMWAQGEVKDPQASVRRAFQLDVAANAEASQPVALSETTVIDPAYAAASWFHQGNHQPIFFDNRFPQLATVYNIQLGLPAVDLGQAQFGIRGVTAAVGAPVDAAGAVIEDRLGAPNGPEGAGPGGRRPIIGAAPGPPNPMAGPGAAAAGVKPPRGNAGPPPVAKVKVDAGRLIDVFEDEKNIARFAADEIMVLQEINKNVGFKLRFQQPRILPAVRVYAYRRPAAAAKDTVRGDFTETLYWNAELGTDAEGKATISFDVSDRVTRWRIVSDAHGENRVGQAEAFFETRLPLEVSLQAPSQAVVGDRMKLPLSIAAEAGRGELASIQIAVRGGLRLIGAAREELVLREGEGRMDIEIEVEEAGAGVVEVSAQVGRFEDSVRRSFPIERRGFPHRRSTSGTLVDVAEFSVGGPEDAQEGSLRARLRFFPGTMAEIAEGLEGLLGMPHGCFEQTSSTNYPNVLALALMDETGVVEPALQRKAVKFLKTGYKKLAGYECKTRGYEWWGSDPGHEALSAYGLLQFTDMKAVYPVEDAMIQRTRDWLLKRRDGQGGYQRSKKALDQYGRAPVEVTDAYITYALAVTGTPATEISKELDRLEKAVDASDDPYVIALAASALHWVDRKEPAARARAKLREVQEENGSLTGTTSSITSSGSRDLRVESTAFAVLAWSLDADSKEAADRAATYLRSCRKNNGRFGSTQATIMALKALTTHARINASADKEGYLRVSLNGQLVREIHVGPWTRGVIEVEGLEELLLPGRNDFRITLTEGLSFPWTFGLSYVSDLPADDPSAKLIMETSLRQEKVRLGDTLTLDVVVENQEDETQGMGIAIVGLPSGLRPSTKVMDDLVKEGAISFWERKGSRLMLYWRSFEPGQRREVAIELVAELPGVSRGPASEVWLYYEADYKRWCPCLEIEVQRD